MRRLAILVIGGALWLILAAIPAMADGGPHVMKTNNGSGGISADGCASCHRVHTSKSPTGYLLVTSEATITDYCRSCHGAAGTGAATDVDTGIQFALGGTNGITRTTGVVGALRGGGFVSAYIGSDLAYRLVTAGGTSASNPKVPPAGTSGNVTSAHLAVSGSGLTAKNVVWGNGILGTPGAGETLAASMECTACHNPHGNGNYRILEGSPEAGPEQTDLGSAAVNVTDATTGSNNGSRTRNYTIIQVKGTPGDESTYLLYADQVLTARAAGNFLGTTGNYTAASGDYFHKNVPYNGTGTTQYDGPNGHPNTSASGATGYGYSDPAGFNNQMTAWCSQCHTRYLAPSGSRSTASVDSIYMYRHTTAKNRTCTTCHVAHGTNAVMNQNETAGTTYSANVPFPNDTIYPGDSRLLKVDNRGTCQLCHDPTKGSAATAAGVITLQQGPLGTTPPALLP